MAASKQLPTWDFDIVLEEAERKGIEYHLVPTGGQHLNGLAEQMIGMLKKQMHRSFEGRRYSHEEVYTFLQETAHVVNSRMLHLSQWTKADPICLVDLLLGRVMTQALLT